MNDGILVVTGDSLTQAETGDPLPAIELYQGSFQEVRAFYQELESLWKTELRIVSAKYGLLRGNERIEPYSERNQAVIRKAITQLWGEVGTWTGPLLLILKSEYIQPLLKEKRPRPHADLILFVGAETISGEVRDFFQVPSDRFHTYKRVGVARIGNPNQEAILTTLREEWG